MQNKYPISNLCDFEIMISSQLTDADRKNVLKLYMPIVGDKVISLYQTLYTFVEDGNYESEILQHEKIIRQMHLRSLDRFVEIRNKLEAIGLLETYYNDNLYIYLLKKPLDGIDFFNNVELSTLLEYQVGEKEYAKIYCEYAIRKLDVNKFERITHTFDEIYNIEPYEDIQLAQAIYSGKNNGIVINNKKFDFARFSILIGAHDVIKETYFVDQEFMDLIARYSFLYQLNEEEMKDAVIRSCDENKNVDYAELAKVAKSIYNSRGKKVGVVPVTKVKATTKTNNKLITFLETASPNDFVKQKTGTALTGNEIEMFDQLLRDTNISIGVLNVLIGYVLVELNGQIPNYNYFLKIINTWKRAKVVSTLDALDYINNLNTTKKTKTSYRTKTQKSVPSWYQDYKNDLNPKIETNEEAKTTNSDLEELRKFFNPEKED